MNAVAGTTWVRRWAATPVRWYWSGILLLALCSTGCASAPPVSPTPGLANLPTIQQFTDELLNTTWELDHVLVKGETRPAFHEGQCFAIGSRPESYYYFDGCNEGYCDAEERRAPDPKNPKRVCSTTMKHCQLRARSTLGTPGAAIEWGTAFQDALTSYSKWEVRDDVLWVYGSLEGGPTLVFRRMDRPCAGQDGYLRP